MVSATVTTEVQVAELPFTSVTRRITLLVPTFAQPKLTFTPPFTSNPPTPQASVLPLLTIAPVTSTRPAPFNCAVTFRQIAVGRTVSATVTTEVQVAVLPLTSVTSKVTLLAPMFAQE